MTALLLARIQTGLAIGVHYIFPTTTLGLSLFILIFESLYMKTKKSEYKAVSSFLVKLFAPAFIMGVATGLLLPFSFGTNWAGFARFGGNVFGVPLAIEGITAFSIESVSIAILLFGRTKVKPAIYWLSAFLIFFSTHLSGFWIVCANSWMQTPAGYEIVNGHIALTNFWAALLNPSAINRFLHVIMATWITGSTIVLVLGAFLRARGRNDATTLKMLHTGAIALLVTTVMEVGIGHAHIMDTVHNQPGKDASFEGIFHTTRNAPLYLFGIPDEKNERIIAGIGIPSGLSFLETFRF